MSRHVPSRRVKLTMAMAVLTTALILALPAAACAKTWHVSTTGNDTTGNGSVGSPYATVQHAVGSAVSGDVVQVGPGTFSGDITMKNGVSLQGAGAKETTLTASGTSPVVAASSIGTTTSISGVTISGNNKGDGIDCDNASPTITNDIIGGNSCYGIYCDNSSSPTITNDTITGNSYSGIYCYNSSPTITNDTISGNSNNGIYCYNSSPTITNDTITGNSYSGIYCDNSSPTITNDTISGNAYGIDCETSSSPTITNDTISGNDYNIYCDYSSPTITNDTISDGYDGIDCNYSSPAITNDTISGNAYGIDCMNGSSPTITNCIVWDSGSSDLTSCTATYSDISSVVAGTGNISADVSFVDTAAGDFHLNAGSPCIDAGTSAGAPATDKDGVPRPQGNGYDMGAYEYHPLTCQLHYTAGSGGTLSGITSQTVNYNASGSSVTATPTVGDHFAGWSDGVMTATRTDSNITADLSVTANFAPNAYTIAFNSEGGSAVSAITQGYNTVVSAPNAPTRIGYSFAGWYSDAGLTAPYTFTTMPASNITLYGAWTTNSYTISFDSEGGSTVASITQAFGTVVTAPSVPTAIGLYFAGWYSDSGLNLPYTFTTMPASDLVLYARWTDVPVTYTLHYTAGSHGSIVGSSTQVVILGSSGTTVTAKPVAGYHFVSWSDGVLTAVRADKNVEASHTVTATFAFTLLKTKLTIASNKTTATRGTTVAFSGTISPHMPNGTHVAVQICKSGSSTWTTLSKRSTFSSYHWSYSYKIPKTHAKGTYYVRVRYAGSTKYLSCVSGNRKLVIK